MVKKSFANANPAMAFISISEETVESVPQTDIEAVAQPTESTSPKVVQESNIPMKRNPEYIETKSKRVQMLMQPSLHAALRDFADAKNLSVNEAMHEILKDYVEQFQKH